MLLRALRHLLLGLGISSAFGAMAATNVYTQLPGNSLADTSAVWNNPGDPGFTWSLDGDEQAWAYFGLPASVSFDRIGWWGSNADGNFAVDLFSANCFSCSANWVTTDGAFSPNLLGASLFSPAQVHKSQVSANLYSYYIDLPSAITLDGSSPYYALSVVNNYSSQPFQWANATSGIGSHLRYIVGQSMFLNAPANLAFVLTDTSLPAPPVPEPETYLMLLAGLGLIGGIAQHKAKSRS